MKKGLEMGSEVGSSYIKLFFTNWEDSGQLLYSESHCSSVYNSVVRDEYVCVWTGSPKVSTLL